MAYLENGKLYKGDDVYHYAQVDLNDPNIKVGIYSDGENRRTVADWAILLQAELSREGYRLLMVSNWSFYDAGSHGNNIVGYDWVRFLDGERYKYHSGAANGVYDMVLADDDMFFADLHPGDMEAAFPNWESVTTPGFVVIKDGQPFADPRSMGSPTTEQPRIYAGIQQDRTFTIIAVDGRVSNSDGMTEVDLEKLGAAWKFENSCAGDGGGSVRLYLVREDGSLVLLNQATENRAVPNIMFAAVKIDAEIPVDPVDPVDPVLPPTPTTEKDVYLEKYAEILTKTCRPVWNADIVRITQMPTTNSTNEKRPHMAVDQGQNNDGNEPIFAMFNGTVIYEGYDDPFYDTKAICIAVQAAFGPNPFTRYVQLSWHFERTVVSIGEKVRLGQTLGYEGRSGLGSGPHSHDVICIVPLAFEFKGNFLKELEDHYAVNMLQHCYIVSYQQVMTNSLGIDEMMFLEDQVLEAEILSEKTVSEELILIGEFEESGKKTINLSNGLKGEQIYLKTTE